MSTLTEIQSAALALPDKEQEALLSFLLHRPGRARRSGKRKLKAASRPALEGLPASLSTNTKTRVRELMARRHAPNR